MSKMATHALVKQNWKIEDYLLLVDNIKDRMALSKLTKTIKYYSMSI